MVARSYFYFCQKKILGIKINIFEAKIKLYGVGEGQMGERSMTRFKSQNVILVPSLHSIVCRSVDFPTASGDSYGYKEIRMPNMRSNHVTKRQCQSSSAKPS